MQVAALANIGSNYLVAGKEARRWGTAHESIVPYQVFPAKDGHVAIAAANQKLWTKFCAVIERGDLAEDARFDSNPKRVEHRKVLFPWSRPTWREDSRRVDRDARGQGIPCGPVNNMEDVFSDPQVLHRGMVREVDHPTIGNLRLAGIPLKYSDARLDPAATAAARSAHRRDPERTHGHGHGGDREAKGRGHCLIRTGVRHG